MEICLQKLLLVACTPHVKVAERQVKTGGYKAELTAAFKSVTIHFFLIKVGDMSVKDISKYEEFLKSFLNSKLTSKASKNWSEDNPEICVFNENDESFIINDNEIVFESLEENKEIKKLKYPTLRDIVNSLSTEYITFKLCADEADEFQKRTVYENVFPHELNSVIFKVLEKVFSENSTGQ
ncbi:hypothetical protein VWJ25_03740 [Escherichia coli O157]|uniref:Uncharacterized protein n=1 Tax=Escherichia phage vB_Eco_slurp01 TaxID=1874688 RepID=A0A1C3S682_9CAUD|nr:hypothetical protein [Escherichia coli O157]SCA80023.1 hypothetical protein PSLUR01_00042 [Escherichia phage vB_Eco_slurp01]